MLDGMKMELMKNHATTGAEQISNRKTRDPNLFEILAIPTRAVQIVLFLFNGVKRARVSPIRKVLILLILCLRATDKRMMIASYPISLLRCSA